MLEWREHIVQPPKCTDGCVLFAATANAPRAMQTHCLHPLLHYTTTLMVHSQWRGASGDKSFRRDVFSRDARQRHHLMCILAAAEPTLLYSYNQLYTSNSFCFAIAGACKQAAEHLLVGIQLYDRLRFCACTQILPALGIQIVALAYSETATTKDLSWLLNQPILS